MNDSQMLINALKSGFVNIKPAALNNQEFIEHFLLPSLGLNNENINEQPPELSRYYGNGLGLRIWQYPNQFSKYASLISSYASKINSYMEIGCRYGGTYIFHVELIAALNGSFSRAIAVDIIEQSPILEEYNRVTGHVSSFMRTNSGSDEFKTFISNNKFDLIFIDGDHSYLGVKNDAETTIDVSNIQVFHDIYSDSCPDVARYWNEHKLQYSKTHSFHEFVDQYESVNGNYLGIGVSVRKQWI